MSLTSAGEPRILSLDVLRGFAVLGILAVNALYIAAPWQNAVAPNAIPLTVTPETLWAWLVVHVFFEFKCITLFSMLFGASLYLVGGERDDAEKGARLRRRLSWLALFGLIHGTLIWFGDVLLMYALTGFLVMLARSWTAPKLLFNGVLFTLLSCAGVMLGMLAGMSAEGARAQAEFFSLTQEQYDSIRAAITGGFSSFAQNLQWWIYFFFPGLGFIVPRTAGMMMIGMALFKWGVLSGKSPWWLYVLFVLLGALSFALTAWEGARLYAAGFPTAMLQGEASLALSLLSPFGTLFYVGAFALLLKARVFDWGLRILAAAGRMAFTNYIAQSLIMTTVFWRFGFFGQLSRPELLAVVGVIWIVQLAWSSLWLSVFTMGPLEWVWRGLTNKAWPRFVREKQQPLSA